MSYRDTAALLMPGPMVDRTDAVPVLMKLGFSKERPPINTQTDMV